MLEPEAGRALVEWAGAAGGWGCLHGPVRSLGGGARVTVFGIAAEERGAVNAALDANA